MIRKLNLTTSLSEWSMHWLSSVCSRIIFTLFSFLGIQLMHHFTLDWNPDRRRPGPGSSLRGQRRTVLWEYSWSSDSAHRQPPGPDHGLLSLPRQDRGRAHRLSHGHQTVWSNQLGKYCFYKWMWMNYCQDLLKPSLSLKSFILIHNPTFLEAQSPFILNFQLWGLPLLNS